MTVSLSDATSAEFVGCKPADVLAPNGDPLGYEITVALSVVQSAWEIFLSLLPATPDDVMAKAANELSTSLNQWSNNALLPYGPVPVVVDSLATIGAVTLQNASNLTCGELVALLGQRSPLTIVRLARVDANDVLGFSKDPSAQAAARGAAQAQGTAAAKDSASLNPVAAVQGFLNTLGVGLGVALAIVLVVLGLIYFKKPSLLNLSIPRRKHA